MITNIATPAGVIIMAALLATCAPSGSPVAISTSHHTGMARSAASGHDASSKARGEAKSPASALAEDVNPPQKFEKTAAVPEDFTPHAKLEKASAVAEDINLPRQRIDLVAPPFVHPHEQVATGGPKIYEVTERSTAAAWIAEFWMFFCGT